MTIITKNKSLSHLLKSIISIVFIIAFSISGHTQTKIRVAVAASLLLPMEDIKQAFEKENPEIQIQLISGSSGNLTTQIKNGAPYHIFLSANWAYPEELFKKGFTTHAPQIISNGKMVVWTKSKISRNELSYFFLSEKNRTIAIANPKLAPYGLAAKKWLESKGIWKNVERKIIFGQSISQVNQYIYSGNVDIAFTAISASSSDKLKAIGYWSTIEQENFLIPNGGVILKLKTEKNPQITAQFFNYLLENSSVKIFQQYGYVSNKNPK
ncbi:MAG: molybdate ABC transporter substrate-binding protein [Flammeovirgaceae bacterium]|nr:molybdate ABC transporter substrate-binding protein [Flammeovirgaceae bacterium]